MRGPLTRAAITRKFTQTDEQYQTPSRKGSYAMTTESSPSQEARAQDRDRDRELVRAITDALVLAVGKRAAHHALRRARARSHRTAQRRVVRAAGHLAGYSALLGYIWRQRRTSHHAAA